jgi:PAS domain S-box-containing protein
MARESFKTIINTPRKDLFSFLQKSFSLHNIEFFYVSELVELEHLVGRVRPQAIILHLSELPQQYRCALQTIEKIYKKNPCWFFLITDKKLSADDIHNILPGNRLFVFPKGTSPYQVTHNLRTVKDLYQELSRLQEENKFEKNVKRGLNLIHEEDVVPRMFERLVNFLPKMMDVDYISVFNADANMEQLVNYTQFVNPMNRQNSGSIKNMQKLCESWIKKGSTFNIVDKDDPDLFKKLHHWDWAVSQIYFFPARVLDRTVGGLLLGKTQSGKFDSRETIFLKDIAKSIAQRVLYSYISGGNNEQIDDFANQLIHNRFSEDSLFYLTCKKINEVAQGSNTLFWQYNKGFGFIFPKYFYFKGGQKDLQSIEKNVILLDKEKYLDQLIRKGKIVTLDNVGVDGNFDKSTHRTFRALNYNNILLIPIYTKEDAKGALIVNKKREDDKFNVWEIHRVQEVVKQIEKVIEDNEIVKEAQHKLKQLSRIFELGNEIKLDLNLSEILSRISKNMRKTLGWNDISIVLEDDTKQDFVVNNLVGFNEKLNFPIDITKNISISKFNKFLNSCKKISNSYFYDSQLITSQTNNILNHKIIGEWQEKDLLTVPIETRNKIFGFIVVHDPVDRLKPTQEKIEPLEFYANQAAVAVENAVLFDKLLASEERYRVLAETMSMGLVTCDLQGKIMYVNPAFSNLLEKNNKEFQNQKLDKYFSERSGLRLKKITKKVMETKEGEKKLFDNMELDLLRDNEDIIPVSVYIFPLIQKKEKIGFFIVVNDLREIKRLERMKADFNSMIVHDLRSPMNVIQGFIELIRNRIVGSINQEQEELLDISKENIKKVLTLVDNFLIASKIEVGKFNIDPKLSEINSLVEKVAENHRIFLNNKKIKLIIALDRNLPLLLFDSLRIEQVLNNLISNAIKFTADEGEIFISSKLLKKNVKGEEKYWSRISVKDTGPGIPQDQLKKVFKKYEQIGTDSGLKALGTGLGLTICEEIISQHGGEIWAESEENNGSTFSFILPIESSLEKMLN